MIVNVLGQSAFWMINKALAKKVGLESALLLSELITKQIYLIQEGEINEDDWFFETRDEIQDRTTISHDRQRKYLSILKEEGILEMKEMGIPSKTHYRIDHNKLQDFTTTGSSKIQQHTIYKESNTNKEDIKPIIKTQEELVEETGDSDLKELLEQKRLRRLKKTPFRTSSPVRFGNPPKNYIRQNKTGTHAEHIR